MFFKSSGTDGSAERKRKVIIQIQQSVCSGGKRAGDLPIDPAEQPVFPQDEVPSPPGGFTDTWNRENKAQVRSLQPDLIPSISKLGQAVQEGAAHFHIRKRDGIFRSQLRGGDAVPDDKTGQPPVDMRNAEQLPAAGGQKPDAHGQHFVIVCRLKYRLAAEHGRNDSVGMVNPCLRAGGDSVLPFPELDQPGLILIIEIDRLRVQNHIHGQGRQVIQLPIPKILLPGVGAAGKDILPVVVAEAKGLGKLIEQAAFFRQRHAGNTADDLPLSAMVEHKKKERDQDKKR